MMVKRRTRRQLKRSMKEKAVVLERIETGLLFNLTESECEREVSKRMLK
jgi:hypothetical protein